ncbi:MAG: multifunctional CCA tRNA nucleotidyl transferase/2'3'-cyclic phosphodiesterase/2'nucleotidase/phosphatase [Candidatus Thiodiazotropha sp.]
MKTYLVGGAVRDQLLDLAVAERDWVVIGSTPDEMLAAGFRRADTEFPVFLHPETGEEYALARTEVKTAIGYKGFQVDYGPHITLEQDLLRRDLTINAMAMTESGELIDICGGRDDLDSGMLRHITHAFTEDPVRLLRIARFAAKLGCWGFRVAHATHALMKKMALSDDLMSLNAERIWREMKRAFSTPQPWRFFEVLHRCGALQRLLPELAEGMTSAGHGEATGGEFIGPLKRVVKESEDPVVRCGVALFDTVLRLAQPDEWMRQLRIEKASRQLLNDLLRFHRLSSNLEQTEQILRFVVTLNPRQQPLRFHHFVAASLGLWPQRVKGLLPGLQYSVELLGSPIPEDLIDSGLEGQALGEALFAWRVVRLEEVMRQTRGSN